MSGVPQPVERPPSNDMGARILYMLLFALVFWVWVVCWVLALTALAQLLIRLLAGSVNPELARFGARLARYTQQIIEYLTFATDRVPYPVGES
jgi:cytochrome b